MTLVIALQESLRQIKIKPIEIETMVGNVVLLEPVSRLARITGERRRLTGKPIGNSVF